MKEYKKRGNGQKGLHCFIKNNIKRHGTENRRMYSIKKGKKAKQEPYRKKRLKTDNAVLWARYMLYVYICLMVSKWDYLQVADNAVLLTCFQTAGGGASQVNSSPDEEVPRSWITASICAAMWAWWQILGQSLKSCREKQIILIVISSSNRKTLGLLKHVSSQL